MTNVAGISALPAAIADHPALDLELVHEEEEQRTDRGVERERREVEHGERARLEQRRGHEGIVPATFTDDERDDADDRDQRARDDRRGVPALVGRPR